MRPTGPPPFCLPLLDAYLHVRTSTQDSLKSSKVSSAAPAIASHIETALLNTTFVFAFVAGFPRCLLPRPRLSPVPRCPPNRRSRSMNRRLAPARLSSFHAPLNVSTCLRAFKLASWFGERTVYSTVASSAVSCPPGVSALERNEGATWKGRPVQRCEEHTYSIALRLLTHSSQYPTFSTSQSVNVPPPIVARKVR